MWKKCKILLALCFHGYLQRHTPTSKLVKGDDEFAGHRLELIIGQRNEMYPFCDVPHDFVKGNREGHQFAICQICSKTSEGKKCVKSVFQGKLTVFYHIVFSSSIYEDWVLVSKEKSIAGTVILQKP